MKFIICFLLLSMFGQLSAQSLTPGYYKGDPIPKKIAYLTFDDGPSDWTEDFLDILKEEKVKATFFICGLWAPHATYATNAFKLYRETLMRMIDEGHIVANHTLSHANLAVLNDAQIRNQIVRNQDLFNKEMGPDYARDLILFRPPFGSPFQYESPTSVKQKVSNSLKNLGIPMLWNVDSTDSGEWAHGEWFQKRSTDTTTAQYKRKVKRIENAVLSKAVNGEGIVILMHDTHPTTKDALRNIIKTLKERGYKFRTMEHYIRYRYNKSSLDLFYENQD
ncbi:MAG: polysaccharide deacetylase family protein [Bacteriovoracaceae bacterium]